MADVFSFGIKNFLTGGKEGRPLGIYPHANLKKSARNSTPNDYLVDNYISYLKGKQAKSGNKNTQAKSGNKNTNADTNGNNTQNAYAGSNSSSGSSAPAYDPGDMAYLNDQESWINRLLKSAGSTLDSGLKGIQENYDKERDRANTSQSNLLQDLLMKRQDTQTAKDDALRKVDTGARTGLNSLRNLLARASGIGSSAYQILAPDAVAKEATEQRGGVMSNFGQNFRDLDIRENRAKSEFEQLLEDLAAQRQSREQGLRGDILAQKQQYNESLAEIARQRAQLKGGGYGDVREAMNPYRQRILRAQDAIDALPGKYATNYNVNPIDTSTPSLRDYIVDRANISANQAAGTGADPYAYFRQRRDEDEI